MSQSESTQAAGGLSPDRYSVRYYDAALSRKGQGVQRRNFKDRMEAEAFAATNIIYAKPCVVEVMRETEPGVWALMGPASAADAPSVDAGVAQVGERIALALIEASQRLDGSPVRNAYDQAVSHVLYRHCLHHEAKRVGAVEENHYYGNGGTWIVVLEKPVTK